MDDNFPGPKTRAALERGIPLFKNGLRFDAEMERAGQRGFRPVRQIVIDKAEGDFVWDLDGKRYIDLQNGWATNPLGNCHPEILESSLERLKWKKQRCWRKSSGSATERFKR